MTTNASGGTLLVVEDDEHIAEPLIYGLRAEGFHVIHARDGVEGVEAARRDHPDLVLLDVMLPKLDGFGVARQLRTESVVPIIMLTARGQEMDRVMGLELGADDYVAKPFSFRELLARIRALLRRRELDRGSAVVQPDEVLLGPLKISRATRQVWRDGREVALSHREMELLLALATQIGRAVPRQDLFDSVWGANWVGDARTLDVHIRWLREKLEADASHPAYLQTVRGFGYRLSDQPGPPTAP
ncbi:MAG: response regulator transcription factor [Dehalococcoidia bacterium]|nr:response regulator transcription factor [Dehalococcoidia bacterium]